MKRLLTFLALCCLVVTGAWAEGNLPTEGSWTVSSWVKASSSSTPTSNFYECVNIDIPNVVVSSDGDVTVSLVFSNGSHRQLLEGVELINANGDVVAHDYHEGSAGGAHSKNTYTLSNVAAGTYTVRCWSNNRSDNDYIDCNGTITVTGVASATKNWTKQDWTNDNSLLKAADLKALYTTRVGTNNYWHMDSEQVTFTKNADVDITYTYTAGNERLDIIGVELLDASGNLVQTAGTYDGHAGYAGIPNGNNTYSIHVPAGTYTIRTWANYLRSITNTAGKITYKLRTFDPEKLYTLYEPDQKRGYLAYNPDATGKVGLADVELTGYTGKGHASSNDPRTGIAFKIIEEPAGTVKFYCEKNSSYVKLSGTTKDCTAQWTTTASEAATFTYTKEGENYLFQPTSTSLYLNSFCGYTAAEGPVRLGDKEGTTDWQVKEYVAPEPTTYTYDITITANGANVSSLKIDGEVYAAGEATFDHAIQNSDVTVTEEAGYSYTLNITQPSGDTKGTIVLTYAAQTPDESLAMLETPGTYYVYIKDGGKYLHNNDNGAVTAIESAERSQSEIERSNAHIWRLVSDGENVTITNGVGNGYNSATPNTVALADIPTTWHLDNIVESKIWHADVRYAEEGCIYYGTMPAYNGGFFATAKDVKSFVTTAGSVEGWYAGHITNDEWSGTVEPTLTLRYYTEEERLEMPYLVQLTYRIINAMYSESVGYAPLSDDDLESLDPEIAELIITFSIDPELTGEAPAEYYRETLAALNMLAESSKDNIIMPQAGQAFRLSVRSTDGHDRWYLKNDGGVSTNAADAAVFVMGNTGTEDYGMLFASNDQTNSKYLQYKGATGTAYAENTCDFEVTPMVKQTNSNITADMAHRFGTFSLKTKARPDDAALNGTMVLKEDNQAWDKSKTPFMNGTYSSAIELEEVEYPYTKPNLASGTGDGHEGYFASVWLPFPMVIPDGIEVYKGTQERTVKDEPYLGLTKVDPDNNQCYAAGGYILYSSTASAGEIKVLPANGVPTDARETDDAAFVGSTVNPGVADTGTEWTTFSATFNGATPYVLANKSKGVGFYKYTGTKLPKGKAIWLKPGASSAECVKLGFDDIISAIEALHGNTTNAEIFDLQGRRLDKVQKGQINVINGQKIMFK